MYVTEPIPEGYTELRVTEMTAINNTHAYIMETASNLETGTFFTRLFVATLTGTGATNVLGKTSSVGIARGGTRGSLRLGLCLDPPLGLRLRPPFLKGFGAEHQHGSGA